MYVIVILGRRSALVKKRTDSWYEREIKRFLASEYHPGDKALAKLRAGCKNPEEVLTILMLARDRDLDTATLETKSQTDVN